MRKGRTMDKNALKECLNQYKAMKNEAEDLKRRIQSLEDQIAHLESTVVSDTVTCGRHNRKPIRKITIKGVPRGDIEYKRKKLYEKKSRYYNLQIELLEKTSECETFISEIPDSWTRQIFRYRYIDGYEWAKVGHMMKSTADSLRKVAERYLETDLV